MCAYIFFMMSGLIYSASLDAMYDGLKTSNRGNIQCHHKQKDSREEKFPKELSAEKWQELARKKDLEVKNILSSSFNLYDVLSLVYGSCKISERLCADGSTETDPQELHKPILGLHTQKTFTVEGLYQKTDETTTLYEIQEPDTKLATSLALAGGFLGFFAGFGFATAGDMNKESVAAFMTGGVLICAYLGYQMGYNQIVLKKRHVIPTYKQAEFPNDIFHLSVDKHFDLENTTGQKVSLVCHHMHE